MSQPATNLPHANELNISLERDLFFRTLIREIAGTLQDVIGLEEAEGFISMVGQNMGDWINSIYQNEYGELKLTAEQVEEVLLDLKARIGGDFYIIEKTEGKTVFGNRTCPFEDKVEGRPCMCMMTSNVFGSITASNLGYAKVNIANSIAAGDQECKVTVFNKRSDESKSTEGREYFEIPK